MMRKILSPIGLLAFISLYVVFGPHWTKNLVRADIDSPPEAEYSWTAPEFGTEVDHYVVQILVNDLDTLTINPVPSEYISVPVIYGNKYQVRVAGISAAGIQGGFSLWSILYSPELAEPGFFSP